jgi:peptidoglycan/xylan/chitin deacetylase (PgdA/CDA1 family)
MMKISTTIVSLVTGTAFLIGSCSPAEDEHAGQTEILPWQDGKKAAISLTYDDGSINQFRVALPMMEELGFTGTFFINTGTIPGSQFQARFIGRPVEEIIAETATVPTDPGNLFERASAVGFLGYPALLEAHTRAGAAVDAGDPERACRIIDEAYARVRAGSAGPEEKDGNQEETGYAGRNRITWNEIREFSERGHEFASHTISHPRLAILDEANMRWELEKCGEEILHHLGPEHTFSCECPYGTENERVMEIALELYPALRNRMPHPWLEEFNRSSRRFPGGSDKTYVQWQRGPLSGTPLEIMNSWIDTCLMHDNIWLVLVFHGVEGIGWEALTRDTLNSFFSKIKSSEQDLWVATFADVTRYMRERMSGKVQMTVEKNRISVDLTHDLDQGLYHLPLSLRTSIPDRWKNVRVLQLGTELDHEFGYDQTGKYITYQALPNQGPVVIQSVR